MSAKDPFTRDIKVGEDWTIPNANGVGRRVIVQGAVWTVPVVAFATNAPGATASPTATLEFTQPSYSGTACNEIVGVKVQLTTDGTAPAGANEPISVTLADGYTFANGGGTTFNGFTQPDGSVTLPDIVVPVGGGDSVFSAFSGSLTDTAHVSAPILTTAYTSVNGAAGTPHPTIPSGSTTAGYSSYLAPNGDLYYGSGLIASNVTSAFTQHDEDFTSGTDVTTYISNGTAYIARNGAVPPTGTAVPADSTVVGYASYLAPNGDLYFGGNLLAQNVTSAVSQHNEYSTPAKDIVNYVSNGTAYGSVNGAAGTARTTVPSGSTAVGYETYLAPNGDLYFGGTRIAQNVTSAIAEHDENSTAGTDVITFISNGTAYIARNGVVPPTGTAVPAGSTVVGYASYLAPNGDLYFGANVLDQNVISANSQHVEYSNPAKDVITYVKGVCA